MVNRVIVIDIMSKIVVDSFLCKFSIWKNVWFVSMLIMNVENIIFNIGLVGFRIGVYKKIMIYIIFLNRDFIVFSMNIFFFVIMFLKFFLYNFLNLMVCLL